MSSKRLSKRLDSKFLNVPKEKDLRCHSDNDLTALQDLTVPHPAAAANGCPAKRPSVISGGGGGGGSGTPEFGSSCSVLTAGGGSSDAQSVSEGVVGPGGRGRAESLELGRQTRPSFARSSLMARDKHPNGIASKHRNSGPSELFSGSTLLLSGSLGIREGSFGRASQRKRMMRDPEEHAKLLRRYHELREILADIREQKRVKEAQLQRLLIKERELTSKPNPAGVSEPGNKCVSTQFLVAVDTAESEADSSLSAELDSVQQKIVIQKSLIDAHIRLLREAKASRQPRQVTKQRATDYQEALEKLSKLNLEALSIRNRMSNSEQYDDDTISQSSSFAYYNGYSSSSAYHSSSRNPDSAYYSESLLSGQLYDSRSTHVSDLSRESSIRSAVSANASIGSSIPISHASAPQPSSSRRAPIVGGTAEAAASPVVRRCSNLAANARSGSKWRRSNSMGNLLGDQPEYQQTFQPQHPSAPRPAPTNTSFPPELPPSQPPTYRRTSGADQRALSYRYQPKTSLDPVTPAASGHAGPQLHQPHQQELPPPALSASHQSPFWYTPRTRLEPAAPLAVHRQQRKQYTSDL